MRKWVRWVMLGLVVALATSVGVYYGVNGKEETIALFDRVCGYVNQPLPIIGVSAVVLCGFAVKVIQMSSFGKKELERNREAIGSQETKLNETKAEQERRISEFIECVTKALEEEKAKRERVEQVVSSLPNKNCREYAKELEDGKDIETAE